MTTHPARLFFALWPPAEVRAALEARALALLAGQQGRLESPQRWHLTLLFLGAQGDDAGQWLATAKAIGAGVRGAPFGVRIDRSGAFGHAGVGWLGGDAPQPLLALVASLREQALARGVALEAERAYTPHLTLVRRARPPLPVAAIEPVDWPVSEFVLAESVPPPAPYQVRGRWALGS